jgi:CRISPR-associated exonuclease Cas4
MNTITENTSTLPHLTGTHINYYHVCTRKLWLFHYGVTMEHKSDLVALGRLVHEESYDRDRKEIPLFEGIKIDRITPGGVIHEVKKSNKLEDAHVWQLKYYLYVLKQQNIWPLSGKLEYPKLRKTVEVNLTAADEKTIEDIMQNISKILESETPPKVEKMKICRKCAYFEYCWG